MTKLRRSTISVAWRKVFTFKIFKRKKKEKNLKKENDSEKKNSEASKQPKAGGRGKEIPPANTPAASITKATTFSTPAVARTTPSASTVAGTTLPTTSAAIRTSENREKKNENTVQSMVPPEHAPEDISHSTHGLLKAIADTGDTTTSANKTAGPSPKGPKDKGPRAEREAAGDRATPGNTSVEKDGEEAVPQPKPDPDNDKLWYSEETPVWNQAMEEWRKDHRKDFDKFKARTAGLEKKVTESSPGDNAWDWLTELKPVDKNPKQAAARLKRWQPVLSSLRGIAMGAAAFDPHKIAPIVCATIFGGLDILFNVMNPEDRDRILDSLCQCGNTINEGNTFEITFFKKSYPTIAYKMTKMRELLKRQYLTALIFACKIRERCEGMQTDFESSDEYRRSGPQRNKFVSWFTRRGNLLWHKMSNEVLEWEGGLKKLGRLKSEWAVKKDDVKESIALDENTVTVRKWLRKEGYPDPSPSDIRSRVMPDGRYSNGADWFLEGDAFHTFCAGLSPPDTADGASVESSASNDQDGNSARTSHDFNVVKRVLWLRGGLGTGKTTVLSLVFENLSTFGGLASDSESVVKIVPYFCDASEIGTKRADCETIIRAMIRRMALQSNGTLAKDVNAFYHEQQSSAANDGDLKLEEDWCPLFKKILPRSECHIVFLVDALDECEKPADWEKLLKFMKDIIQLYPNVRFICSSHCHLSVDKFFQDKGQDSSIVAIEDMNAGRNREALRAYINGEIQRREADAGENRPDSKDLKDELRDTLLQNARGVFQWAKIWLNILLAVEDTDRTAIRSENDAREWLDRLKKDSREPATDYQKLTNGYQRLWDITCKREHDDFKLRARLFQFVLAANVRPTIQMLTAALRIRNDKFDRYPQPKATMRLCSNFLILNDKWKSLEFVHSSARNFIRDLNMKQDKLAEEDEEKFFSDHRNHESVARLYMDLIGSAMHPYWTEVGIEINKWNEYAIDSTEMFSVMQNLEDIGFKGHAPDGTLAAYFATHGLTHFPKAARKRSLDDPVWKDFIHRLVLPSDSAFGAFLLDETDEWFSFSDIPHLRKDSRWCLHSEGGRLRILPSHILARLPVFDTDDCVSSTSTRDTDEAHDCVELLKDMCTLGGNFKDDVRRGVWARPTHPIFEELQPIQANALQLACVFDNVGAVRAILRAAKLSSPNTLSEMLRSTTQIYSYPLFYAMQRQNVTIASILLEADRQPVSGNAETGGPDGLSFTYTSSQWELETGTREPLLKTAVELLKQEEMLSLLKVAQPEDINQRYKNGNTLLHCAVEYKMYVLARALVLVYGADKTVKNNQQLTPFEYGTRDGVSVLYENSWMFGL
ncbi:hypothetical protein MMC07_008896 [Pseudocyphellaria aurata]|nr:hypothetical protein [Pseudocyphellaria aurata]